MNKFTWISTLSATLLILLTGCAPAHISGGLVMLEGKPPVKAIPIHHVRLFLGDSNEDRPKISHTIALVTASTSVSGDGNIAEVEAKVLTKLREQAATAGATGIINISREFSVGDTIISSTSWGVGDHRQYRRFPGDLHLRQRFQDQSISKTYLLVYRGTAITFEE